ncbi:putative ribonuclease H-like domain-containing protein [Tanacetum coccineum]
MNTYKLTSPGWELTRPKAINTVRPHSAVVNAVRANQANAVKASAYPRYVIFSGGVRGGNIIGSEVSIGEGSTSKETDTSQDYIVMPLWKDSSLFDSFSMNTSHDEPSVSPNCKLPDEGIYKTRTARVEENLHYWVFRDKSIIEGNDPKWLFDIDSLTQSMNYVPVAAVTITNESACTQGELNVGTSIQKEEISQDCIVMPIWKDASYFDSPSKDVGNGEPKSAADDQKQVEDGPDNENDEKDKYKDDSNSYDPDNPKDMFKMGASHTLEATHVEFFSDEDEPEVVMETSLVPIHPLFCKMMTEFTSEQGFLSAIKPTSIAKALSDSSWVEAMQEELLQFKLQQVWKLVDLPNRKRAIGTKWVFRNKKDERGIVIRNKARLVAQGHRQEEGIDYEEVFAPVARIEAIRLFLAYASFMDFLVYQMDVKSAFLYATIEEEALYGLHQAPRAWYETLANYLLGNGFKRGKIDQTLFIKKQKGDILLVQVYVDDIIFGSTNKELCTGFEKLMKDKFQMSSMGELTFFLGLQSCSTPVDLEKPLVKDGDANDVDVHLYRSMIGSLMYLTASRPDIMFAVCACARFQVTLKTSHLLVVKRIFRYLKGKPTLGLWYSRDSPFELVAYTDSDYAGATQDRKSTTGGSEYVAAASCCGQVLWIQNQLLDYGYNFMNTMIHIDNNSTICIIENPVQHSKTKHIEIRHHFIRDCNAKKLIQMVKIDTEHNVADLLTKGFDAGRLVKRGWDTKIPQSSGPPVKVGDEAVHKEVGDRMERAATTASSLEAEQSNDPPLSRVNTLGSGEDSMKLMELMAHCTKLSELGSLSLHGLTDLCTSQSKKVARLEFELKQTKLTYNAALTKLIKRVKKLEQTIKTNQARRRAKVVISDDEEAEEDPSNQERSLIEELDLDAGISLVPPHAADQGRIDDTHISDQLEEQLGVFSVATALADAARRRQSNVQTYTRRRREVSTGSGGVSTASRLVSTSDISTASELDSTAGVKAKDKGKAIMHESEPPKKIKKRVQVQMSVDEELAKKVFEEEQARFNAEQEARFKAEQEQERIDFETALELQKQLDEREEVAAKVDQAHDIDWSDPAVLRYHTLQNRPFSVAEVRKNICLYLKNQGGYKLSHFKGMKYEDIRHIFEKVWDQNQAFIPMEEIVQQDDVIAKQVVKESSKTTRGRRKKSLARKRAKETLSEESVKKQKLEDDTEKEEL